MHSTLRNDGRRPCWLNRFLRAGPQGVNCQLLSAILGGQGDARYSYGVAWDEQEGIDLATQAFLTRPHPTSALNLFSTLLGIHEKASTFSPLLAELSRVERLGSPSNPTHRDHVIHADLVYCLGLYMYLTFKPLQDDMHLQLARSLSEAGLKAPYDFSAGTPEGEFSFRWRLAALLHDLAYPFQLYNPGSQLFDLEQFLLHVNYFLSKMPRWNNIPAPVILDRANYFTELNALPFLSAKATDVMEATLDLVPFRLEDYVNRIVVARGWVDHGVLGAMLLCKLVDMLYEFHAAAGVPTALGVSWEPHFLEVSVAHAGAAVAYHNIDHTLTVLADTEREQLVKLNSQDVLVGLLRVSDILQEWDRPLSSRALGTDHLRSRAVRFSPDRRARILKVALRTTPEHKDKVRRQLGAADGYPVSVEVV